MRNATARRLWMMSSLLAALAGGFIGVARADITIAVAGPVTGQYAALGEQMKKGIERAVADLNAKGGVLGQRIRLEVGDDACDPKQAVAVANQLIGKGVKFVAGHFCSGSSIPASKVYAEENVIQISPASTNPKLTDERAGPNVFRVCGRDDQQGQVAGTFLAKNFKDKNVAIVHDKSAYGKGLADEAKKYMNQAGKQEKLYESYTAGEKDYAALVSRLKSEAIDVLYVGGYHTEAGLILRQMRQQGMKTLLIGGDALITDEFWSITGPAGEGTLMTFSPDPRKLPEAAPVVEAFRTKGTEPEGYVLYTYAAVQIWAQAVEKAAGSAKQMPDNNEVIEALNTTEFDTVLGKIRFDRKGDVTAPGYVFYVWKDGRYDHYQE